MLVQWNRSQQPPVNFLVLWAKLLLLEQPVRLKKGRKVKLVRLVDWSVQSDKDLLFMLEFDA